MTGDIFTLISLVVVGLAGFYLLLTLSRGYARITHWQPPVSQQDNDWALRRKVGLWVGGVAIIICAVGVLLWQVTWQLRLVTMIQATLLAAAGASDLERFQLPLPLTILGVGVAIYTFTLAPVPVYYLLFATLWVLLIIVVHALLTKGSMQLGDHITTVWIALVSPANGLLAIALGDATNVVFARLKGLRGKKVAAAGVWLIFATTMAATPPYFAWINGLAFMRIMLPVSSTVTTLESFPIQVHQPDSSDIGEAGTITSSVLLQLAYGASEHTASVALAGTHAGRVVAAKQQANHVARFAGIANRVAPDSEVTSTLEKLASALRTYDLDGVRVASQQLALERERLVAITSNIVVTNTN